LFAQNLPGNDPALKQKFQHDCGGKIFTKVETLPSFKISKKAFEDSLTSFLKGQNAFSFNRKFKFRFIVTSKSEIFNLEKEEGNINNENFTKEAIMKFSYFWLPAKQNGNIVCYCVRLELEIKSKKLHVVII